MTEKRGETFVIQGGAAAYKPIEFTTFVLGLASTTLIHLGATPNPETGKAQVDLMLARETLDLISLLHEKTRGNLTEDEQRVLENVLADLRLRFVEASRR